MQSATIPSGPSRAERQLNKDLKDDERSARTQQIATIQDALSADTELFSRIYGARGANRSFSLATLGQR